MKWLLAAGLALAALGARQADSLLDAARSAAAQWMQHDFAGLVGTGEAIMVHLPGAEPSSPLRPTQAAALLKTFTEGARELDFTLLVARNVEPDRAYVEAQRLFQFQGTDVQHTQTIYFGFRRVGESYRLVEVRALP